MIYRFLFIIAILCSLTVSSQNIIDDPETGLTLSISEFNISIQDMLDSGRLDHLYTEEEKKKGVTIIINDLIKPFYKNLTLEIFDKPVSFKNHLEILEDQNEKFLDILDGSTIIHNEELIIIIGVRYNRQGFQANFTRKNDKWIIAEHLQKHKVGTQLSLLNYSMRKEQCLVEKIKQLKNYKVNVFKEGRCDRFDF